MGDSLTKTRMMFVGLFLLACLVAMGVRFHYVQVRMHNYLYKRAKRQYTQKIEKKAERGKIYDRNGFLLAGNIPCANIIADPQQTGSDDECGETAKFLAKQIGKPEATLYQKLTRRQRTDGKENRYALLARNVSWNKSETLREAVRKFDLKGLFFRETTKRYYPQGRLLAQTLGFINVDRDQDKPISGIEKSEQQNFEGEDGKVIRERDRKGRGLSYGNQEIDETVNGKDIFLTIDEQIQTYTEEALDELCEKFKPRAAYAIMADPRTGDILAMAQRPTFNPNDRSTMTPDAWRNRMTTDVFEPGSAMKPIVISTAIDYGIVTPKTKFDCENGYWKEMRLRDSHRMGVSTVAEILIESSNIGTGKIARKMGKPMLYKTFRRFGFGKHTGIPLRPEATSYVRNPKYWDYLSISRFPIGQGIAITPLQLVRAYCALANGGKLVKLRLVDRVRDTRTKKFEKKPYETSNQVFMKNSTSRVIVDIMRHVTKKGGTATRAAIPGFEVAGKTGTSQKWIPNNKKTGVKGHYSQKKFFATFAGFVPAFNPAFVLVVIADEPKGNHYGGVVAAPTFKRIAKNTLGYMNIQPK